MKGAYSAENNKNPKFGVLRLEFLVLIEEFSRSIN